MCDLREILACREKGDLVWYDGGRACSDRAACISVRRSNVLACCFVGELSRLLSSSQSFKEEVVLARGQSVSLERALAFRTSYDVVATSLSGRCASYLSL